MSGSSRRFVDALESRRLLSTSPGLHFTPTPPDATIQADLNAVKAARTALAAAWQADGPTILADDRALAAAIRTAYSNLPTAVTTKLQTDQMTARTDLTTLFTDFRSGASATQITADRTALQNAQTAVRNDLTTIKTDINTDPAVVAARSKLTTDSAPIVADQAALQAAVQKLFTDLRNHA
jgi:hypothetical protein